MPSQKPPVSVVYLARAAEGIEVIERFRQSFVDHPAGMEHDLVVCLKGDDDAELRHVRNLLEPIATRFVAQKDIGYDIHAYLQTARTVDTEWICCINTFSVINKPGWLEFLFKAACRPNAGLVGATASYESRRATLATWIWYMGNVIDGVPMRGRTHDQFTYLMDALENGYAVPRFGRIGRRLKLWGLQEAPFRRRHLMLRREDLINDPPFPGFPNPHVRSNGFMLRTAHLKRFESLGPTKVDCYNFESGHEGLSASLAREGKDLLLVGDQGAFPVDDWVRSNTFRSGEQEALLMLDNQTESYRAMSPATREIHRYFTWGDTAVDPDNFEFPPLPSVKNGVGSAGGAEKLVGAPPMSLALSGASLPSA